MKKYTNILLIIIFIILESFLLFKSEIVITEFTKTLNICLYTLMPTMFFSLLFSQILIKLNFQKYLPKSIKNLIKKIFNINDKEVVVFLLSIICGYPNNAKMLTKNKNLNNIINYTTFVNPIFLICTVGAIYLRNIKLSLIILFSQYISSIIIGIMSRKNNTNDNNYSKDENNDNFLNIYYSSIRNTVSTLVIIFSNILFFSIIISLVKNIFDFNELIKSIIYGLIEFSSGIYSICSSNIDIFLKGLFIEIIITFSSFSIHMQMLSINEKINYLKFIFYRILNIIFAILIYTILYIIF